MRPHAIGFFLFLSPAALLLAGWGHHAPKVKVGLLLDRSQGREAFLQDLKKELDGNDADLVFQDAQGDPAAQQDQAADLIKQGAQALVVFPCDPAKAAPLVESAHQAGVKVIALETPIPGCGLDYLVAFNPEKEGALEAQTLVKKVPQGRYVLLGNPAGWAGGFREGQMEVLKPLIGKGDIQITASRDFGNKVDAVLASNVEEAQDAVQALDKAGLSGKVAVAGVGQDLGTCRRILAGSQTMTVYHPPQKLAEETAYLAAKLARKAKEFDCQFTAVPNGPSPVRAVLLAPLAVDAKNMDATLIHDGLWKKTEIYGK